MRVCVFPVPAYNDYWRIITELRAHTRRSMNTSNLRRFQTKSDGGFLTGIEFFVEERDIRDRNTL